MYSKPLHNNNYYAFSMKYIRLIFFFGASIYWKKDQQRWPLSSLKKGQMGKKLERPCSQNPV